MGEESPVLYETIENGSIAVITLNRPKRLNAMSLELVNGLLAGLRKAAENQDKVRVVILTGNGKSFCSGADLFANAFGIGGEKWDSTRIHNQKLFSSIITTIAEIPQPVIAALKGSCAGGGLAMALACDIRIAGKSAKFTASFLNIGLSGTELGTSFFLPRLVGLSVASEMLLTGDTVSAEKALATNLVNTVVDDERVLPAAVEMAKKMLNASYLGLKLTKRQLRNASEGMSLQAALHAEDMSQVLCLNDPETFQFMTDKSAKFFEKNQKGKL